MKKRSLAILIILSICLAGGQEFFSASTALPTENVSNLLITANYKFGIYGGIINGDESHFIYKSQKQSELIHFSFENGETKKENMIQKECYLESDISFSTFTDHSFSVVYLATEENKSTQRYDHNYYYYYYNSTTKKSEKKFLLNVNRYVYSDFYYSYPTLSGLRFLNDENVFLLSSTCTEDNFTEILVTQVRGTTANTQIVTLPGGRLTTQFSSCLALTTNCAYFFFRCDVKDNYVLLPYNFTSQMLLEPIDVSFSKTNYLIGMGRLLFDQKNNKLFYLVPKQSGYSSDFELFEYNATKQEFILKSTTTNANAIINRLSEDLWYETSPDYFDVVINNSMVFLIYFKNTPYIGRRLFLATYNLTEDDAQWNFADLGLDEDYKPFYACLSYNSITTQEVQDSYVIGFIYNDNCPYHSFGGKTRIVSVIGILGSAVSPVRKPYYIRAIKNVYFKLVIAGAIIVPLTLTGSLVFLLRRKRRKRE